MTQARLEEILSQEKITNEEMGEMRWRYVPII